MDSTGINVIIFHPRMRILASVLLILWLVSVEQAAGKLSSNNSATERKYPSKELYRLIQDRLQTNRRPTARDHHQDGSWSEWSQWSPCSRTCGGGVAQQTRQCLPSSRHRRSVTGSVALRNRRNSSSDDPSNHLNELESTTGSGSRAGCVGLYKRYHMCNTQECPEGSKDFRQAQCESYNGKQFMGRYYFWEAYWDGENPCELNCRALTFRFYALLNKTVIDGTRCRPNDPSRICVSGTCKTVGCDGIVGSEKRLDACGVCGGTNSTCQIVSGIFTEPQLPAGYNLVAQLPKGACHVNITEFKPSRNYLALRKADGTFAFNGNWAINWSGEYPAAGTVFNYRRQDASTPELIYSPGPLTEPIDIMVIYQQINPGIKYEYMLPLGNSPATIPQRPPVQNDLPSTGPRYPPPTPLQQLDAPFAGPQRVSGLGAEGGLFQVIQQQQQSSSLNSGGNNINIPSSLSSSGSLATLGIIPQQFDPVPPPQFDPSPLPALPEVPSSTVPPLVKETHRPTDEGAGRSHHRRRHHGHHNRHHHNNGSHGGSLESQGKHKHSELQATDTNTPPPHNHRRGPRRHSNGKGGFSWKQLGFSECSKTCGGGVQHSLIVCVRDSNQAPVADHRCKEEERLPSETVRCNTKPCPAEWVLSEWSPCSASCGDGVQTREMTCKQEISPTLTMRVNEAACLGPAPSLPRVRSCNLGTCAKWHASEWGKCTASCGKGMRHRRVFCQGFEGREVSDADCPAAEKPSTSDVCDMGSCSTNTWFFTEWSGQCSEECGTGIQTRKAHCSGSSEADCDAAKKPDITRTCVSSKDCNGKWFTGPWSQCSASCDEGTKTRDVICLTFVRGQYRVGLDMQCSAKDKPSANASCNLGKCLPQWYTTDWSECSASCGTGAQRREVKCLDSNQMPSQDCREEDRPMLRHACNARACNEVPEDDITAREAQDTPVISVEMSNRNESEDTLISSSSSKVNKKSHKPPKVVGAKMDNTSPQAVLNTAPSLASGPEDAVPPPAGSSGEGCADKFKNCHLVVQARLCKLKYYVLSCCASCSKSKT